MDGETAPKCINLNRLLRKIFHLVFQFGNIVTYNIFVSLALITAVPVSAGECLDVVLYGVQFEGMKLAGIVLIAVGFSLVMFPDNWPNYIMRLLRWSRRQRGNNGSGRSRDAMDFRTGYIRSHLRSPSGRVRLKESLLYISKAAGYKLPEAADQCVLYGNAMNCIGTSPHASIRVSHITKWKKSFGILSRWGPVHHDVLSVRREARRNVKRVANAWSNSFVSLLVAHLISSFTRTCKWAGRLFERFNRLIWTLL
ncbi:hypothetical protein MSG28_007926 [Choristoneura fumiferana]|uniref:Uncharacterized protein n=1 Tax=Choristoneura fumiferana TaxID=7141 RepID=A0ACC0J999_CHOFU|nr:hypothetical protein MSG28_007926 [Choristoneura fumiferana]